MGATGPGRGRAGVDARHGPDAHADPPPYKLPLRRGHAMHSSPSTARRSARHRWSPLRRRAGCKVTLPRCERLAATCPTLCSHRCVGHNPPPCTNRPASPTPHCLRQSYDAVACRMRYAELDLRSCRALSGCPTSPSSPADPSETAPAAAAVPRGERMKESDLDCADGHGVLDVHALRCRLIAGES